MHDGGATIVAQRTVLYTRARLRRRHARRRRRRRETERRALRFSHAHRVYIHAPRSLFWEHAVLYIQRHSTILVAVLLVVLRRCYY